MEGEEDSEKYKESGTPAEQASGPGLPPGHKTQHPQEMMPVQNTGVQAVGCTGAAQMPDPSDEVQLEVVEAATKAALVFITSDGKCHEMPCMANRPILQLMNRPLAMLVGSAAVCLYKEKDQPFLCVELKKDDDMKNICDWFAGFSVAGIILVNSKDDVSLSVDSWKIVLDHGKVLTVAVVPKCQGKVMLDFFGSDIEYSPHALTRIAHVKIFPKQSEFQLYKGQNALIRIPFQMHWRACCLPVGRVKVLQIPPNTAANDEQFICLYNVQQGDTYASIVKEIPQNVKGIVISNYSKEVGQALWSMPYASNETLLPLYLVGVEHGKLLLQNIQPQQPSSPQAGPVPAQDSGIPMEMLETVCIRFMPASGVLIAKTDIDPKELKCNFLGSVPLGQNLPCHPCRESPAESQRNYRWLKLHPNEKGHKFLERIQNMQRMDKSGPAVVGFIIGSTEDSSDLPEKVLKDISECIGDKDELPPLIVLSAADYDQFQTYIKPHSASVKKVTCLSDCGMLQVRRGDCLVTEGHGVPCLAKQYCGFSEKWLPLFGPSSEIQYQFPYARVVPQKIVSKDVLNEVHSGGLNYIVMARDKKKMPSLIDDLEKSIVFVTQQDLQKMLQFLVKTPVSPQQYQAESTPRGGITDTIARGAAVLRGWFHWGARVMMVEKLNSFDWTSNAKTSFCELGPQLQQLSNVHDKDETMKILSHIFAKTGLKHFPLFVLVAKQLQKSARSQSVWSLYTFARQCNEQEFAQILKDFTKSGDFRYDGDRKSACETMAEAAESFLDVNHSALFRMFWVTLSVHFRNIATGSRSSELWRILYKKSGCAPLAVEEEHLKEMKKWLTLAQAINMDRQCQLSFPIFMTMIENDALQVFNFRNAQMLLCELHDVYFAEAEHAKMVLEMLRKRQTTQTLLEMKQGIELLEKTIVVYKDDTIMMTELHQWMKVWAKFNSATEAAERFCRLKTLTEKMVDVTVQGEMLTSVRDQMSSSVSQAVRKSKVSLENFESILRGLPFLKCEIIVEYFKQFRDKQASMYSISQPMFAHVCNLALERFPTSESLHGMIAAVLLKSMTYDATVCDKRKHLLFLLTIDIPKLFDIHAGAQPCISMQKFQDDWKNFMKDKHMQVASHECLSTFLAQGRKEFTPYQKVVIKAFVPYICIEQQSKSFSEDHPAFHCLNAIIASMMPHYNTVDKWKEVSTPPYDSFWEIISNAALVIPVTKRDLTWCQDWRTLVKLLVKLYQRFHEMTKEEPNKELNQMEDKNVRTYFNWVTEAQESLKVKATGFMGEEWSEEDASKFESMQEAVQDISNCLHVNLGTINIDCLIKEANECRSKAVKILFRCSHGEKVWLLNIISDYHIMLPETIQNFISTAFKSEVNYKRFVEHVGKQEAAVTDREFSRNVPLKDLKSAVATLENVMQPLEDCMDEMVCFHSRESHLFKVHMDLTLGHGHHQLQFKDFVHAVKLTTDFLEKFKHSRVTYKELKRLEFLNLRKAKRESEIALLQRFYEEKNEEFSDFLTQLRDMSNLLDTLKLIPGIKNVFCTFHMQNCTTDSGYQTLVELGEQFSSDEERDNLTGAVASARMKDVLTIIYPLELQQLELFSVVGRSEEFYEFLKTIEQQGAERFHDLHQLITQFMQHEEYNDAVLNQLPHAREYMLPFLDQEQDFNSLLQRVKAMCDRVTASEDFSDLETVNTNMNLIRLWFSKAEDHTLESVQKDLDRIMNTGVFLISEVQQSQSDSAEGCLLLKYQPIDDPTSDHVYWKEDAISDFNRRLGLLERNQGQVDDMSENVDKFQYNYKIARKVFQIWLELKSMGSPKATFHLYLQCSTSKEAAERDLREMKHILKEWKQTLHQMRLEHPELLLFKIHKVFQMFIALQSENVETLIKEMLLLFTDVHKTGPELVITIQEALLQAKEHLALPATTVTESPCAQCEEPITVLDLCGACTTEENGPIEIVGKFLTSAFKLLQCHLPDLLTPKNAMSGGVLQPVVHKAVHRSQRDLLALLWSEYNGKKISPFESYRCRKDTTEEDLSLFFSRMQKFNSVYILLDVNVLPLRLQEVIVKLHKESMRNESNSSIHYVVTGPSLMQDLPQVTVRVSDHDRAMSLRLQFEGEYREQTHMKDDFSTVEIVYGRAGDGKSQYILKKLDSISSTAQTVTLTINESFSVVDAIKVLRQLPLQTGNALYLNFTLLPASDSSSEQDKQAYEVLVTRLQCFLFDLFFLGYVEDPQSRYSFSMPKGLKWHVYVEVPTREFRAQGVKQPDAYTVEEDWNDPDKSLILFYEEYPVLQLVGTPVRIHSNMPLDIDGNAQLVCKYLQAYENKEDCMYGIDRVFRGHESEKVTFRSKPDCPKRECQRLLNIYMPKNAKLHKMNNFIFIKYMARRCMFLDMCPAYNYNEVIHYKCNNEEGEEVLVDTSKLGSCLLESMLKEVDNLCSAQRRSTWGGSGDSRQQLVYVSDGMMEEDGGCFELVALNPDDISEADRKKFARLQVPINDRCYLETRDCLDKYLASAFGVMCGKVTEDGQEKFRLKEIDAKNYVLTLDFAMKMLELNERYHAGVPVIIEGETGVGKTFLVEMMADLWNSSLLSKWNRSLARLWTKLAELCKDILFPEVPYEMKSIALKVITAAENETGSTILKEPLAVHTLDLLETEEEPGANVETVTLDDVNAILQQSHLSQQLQLLAYLKKFLNTEPLLPLLEFNTGELQRRKSPEISFDDAMKELQENPHPSLQACSIVLLHILMAAEPRVYFKKNIHGALTSKDMRNFMEPIIHRANEVRKRWKNPATCPRIIVFLDEINTTSCPGLMKELLVDRSFHGERLPHNVFIIGACNPHRSNSVAIHEKVEDSGECDWVKGSYYVHRLHPTVRCLLWNYGALNEEQEERYIEAKMKMAVSRYGSSTPLRGGTHLDLLSSHIFESQRWIREFAANHYKTSGMDAKEAEVLAKSSVSQRDIQRVFTMYEWLLKAYSLFQIKQVTDHKCFDEHETWQQRAILVALGLVYYFRLNKEYRKEYKERMEDICGDITFTGALEDEMNFYCDTMRLPPGIAKTTALKENLFCIIACCCTKTPLIIIGEPGSSKTLSFNLAAAAFRGIESKIELFKNTDVFPRFDPYYYQCSRRTTSVEVETVFRRAVNRQKAHEVNNKDRVHCVVFMDEAGLPEESMESLKVLHKYLDDAVVSFVGITNHILDAAKTNRAVTLFRPRATDDVNQLAMGCFGLTDNFDQNTQPLVEELCDSYGSLIEDDRFTNFFGLRDFIHLVNYLRRETKGRVHMLSQNAAVRRELVLGGVQRNFNGHEQFDEVCKVFLDVQHSRCSNWKRSLKNLVQLLHESLEDRPFFVDHEDFEEIRYKLIIDPTEDESSRRFLMEFRLLEPKKAKTLVGSDFPDDGDLQKINTIAEITHAASQGETVLMLQTDDIHESFYDLFNQHFRKIPVKGEGGRRTHFYANVAIGSHSKPCRVHPQFQCIVVIKESDLATTPAPFLNRFEKYRLSPKSMLEAALDHLPRGLQVVVQRAEREVLKLVNKLDKASFCGMRRQEDTIVSVFLDMVPKTSYTNVCLSITEPITISEDTGIPSASLLKFLLQALKNAGFNINEHDIDKEWDVVSGLMKEGIPSLCLSDIATDATDAWAELTNPDSTTDPQDPLVRFIQDVLCHWMYATAAKKILQILTPEALILWRRSKAIPQWCFDSYLKQQHHFNLKDLIMCVTQQSSSEGFLKVVCFTRSSQTVSQLSATGDTSEDEMRVIENIVVTNKPERVKLCRMSTVSSQQEFSEQLAEFQSSTEKDIMLIVANMHEATKKVINYVRLRIDEEEEKWIQNMHEMTLKQEQLSASDGTEEGRLSGSEEVEQEFPYPSSESVGEDESCEHLEIGEEPQSSLLHLDKNCEGEPQITDEWTAGSFTDTSAPVQQPAKEQTKTFVLLLHFPPSVSQRACYPAMFLYGWDYHYLDSLVASAECAIPLNEWCQVAFHQTADGLEQEKVTVDWAMQLDRTTALVMASRIALYDRSNGSPVAISADKKADTFRKLLQGPLGQKLHDLYSSYWSPKNVAKFLQGAAVYARCRMSMISVTDVVQNFFESTFHNFLAYMLYHISEELGLDTYVDETEKLFQALLDFVPRPKSVSDLKGYNNTWGVSSDVSDQLQASQFPGFSKICASIEACLRKRFDEMMVQEESAQSLTVLNLKDLSEHLQEYADTRDQERLKAVLPYLKEDDTLWQRYESDFITFQFAVTNMTKMKPILEAVVSRNCTVGESNLERLVALHYLAFSRHLDVAALEAVIDPLQSIQMEEDLLSFSSVVERVLVQGSESSHSEMAYFIIESLFGSLVKCIQESRRLQDWLKTCRSILFTSNMEQILYSGNFSEDYCGKFNMVQATFLLLQSAQDDATVHKLLTCLSELLKSEQSFAMKDIFTNTVDVQNASSNNQDYVSHLCQHFFHSFRPHFHENDTLYFFQFVATLQFDSLANGKYCVTLGVLKHFMLTVLDGKGDTRNYYGFSSKTAHILGLQLEKWAKSAAENYHPPCFGIEAPEDPPSSLAHIYFLTLLDKLRLKYKFEKQQRSHLRIHEMLHSMKCPTGESSIMHAIEKQALLHVFTKQLSVALQDDSQVVWDAISRKGLLGVLCNDRFHTWHKQMLMDMLMRLQPSEKKKKWIKEKLNTIFAVVADHETEREHLKCYLQNPWTFEEMKSFVAKQNQATRGQREKPHILLLHRLMDKHEKLNAGLDLIPTLLQFCSKLKKHLDSKYKEQEASTMTLKAAVEKACSEMKAAAEKRHLRRGLLNEFIEKFNVYQSTLGKAKLQDIGGDTLLRHILCLPGERSSAVTQTLDDICATCNSFIGVVHKCAQSSISLHNWVVVDQPPVSILQHRETWQLLSRSLNKESIMKCFRRCLPVHEDTVNFEQLSAEVIKTFFFGLSVSAIELDQLSTEKAFRLCCKSAGEQDHSSATEYSDVCTQLRAFPRELEDSCRKDVVAHFHGVNHQALQRVVNGLLTIAHHLTQAEDALCWAKYTLSHYIQGIDESYKIKDFVSLPRDMSGALDLHFLETFQVENLIGALNLLVNWLNTGFCNFHTLPLGVKKEMSAEMVQCMEEKAKELQAEQKTNLLLRLEDAIPPEVMGFGMGEFDTSAFELPLKQYLKEHRICKSDTLLQCIPEEVQLEHYVQFLILIRSLTKEDRMPTFNEETDTSDFEDEEVVESEDEGDEEEEEDEQHGENEEAHGEYSNAEDWEQLSGENAEDVGGLNAPGWSNPVTGDGSLRNWSADGQLDMYGADITQESKDPTSSLTTVNQQGEDGLISGEYESEEDFQSASDNDSGSDDSIEERLKMYKVVYGQQSYSVDTRAQSILPSQSSVPNDHQSVTGDHFPELESHEDEASDEFLSASEGDEESFDPHGQSLVVKEGNQTEIVSVQGADARVTQDITQKQPATDLPHHQFQDTEDTLEQVINLPEQTQAVQNVSQSKTLSEQSDRQSSVWVEEAPPSAQLPGPSPAASIRTPSITMQGEMQSSVPVEEAPPSTQLPGASPAASITTPSSTVQGGQPELQGSSRPETVNDVGEWLKKIGMSQYVDKFAEEEVDGQLLVELGKEDLPYLGVVEPFHQKKILLKIKEMKK